MSVDAPSAGQREAKNAKVARVLRVILAALSVAAIVIGSFGISWVNRDAAQAAAFAAAPACPPATVPGGNCAGWEQETVSSIEVGRGGADIRLSAKGQSLQYGNDTWGAGLTAGTSISVLVWRDEAQALRDPTGQVVYSLGSARLKRYGDINIAVSPFGLVALYFGLLDISPLNTHRSRLRLILAVIVGSLGAGVFVGGVTVDGSQSVDSGATDGAIAFVSAALVATGMLALARRRRLQRADAVAR